jgi:hypothetical protein
MITEIFIENTKVDVYKDISSLLNFAIDDIKDFAKRSTAYSKTIVLPGTANNNYIFGSIFETSISNDYDSSLDNVGFNFNAAKSARCIIFQDNLQTFKGTLRLLEIVKIKGTIEYEVAINGEITSLNGALANRYLEDLDFSSYDHTYSLSNIEASWDNPGGSGYYYPLIDYGGYSTGKHDWDYRTFRPALYVKEYIDKMFEDADFRYECDFFDTDRFKKLIIPHNQKFLAVKKTNLYQANLTADESIGSIDGPVAFDNTAGTGFTPDGPKRVHTYAGASATILISYDFLVTRTSHFGSTWRTHFVIKKNGTEVIHLQSTDYVHTYQGSVSIPFDSGDTLTINIYTGDNSFSIGKVKAGSSLSATSVTAVPIPISLGDNVAINEAIPKNIKQIDFLVSIVQLFNLYIYESRFDDRKVIISPFIDFYSAASGTPVDWTYKLNRDQPIKIKPMSELNYKIYEFNYKGDSDYYNDLYKKRYNQVYGSYTYDSQYDFSSQKTSLELIFAPTPLVGYTGEDKIYPTIFKKSGTTEETTDCVIRILQSKKITSVTSWDIKDDSSVLDSYTVYPYAGHFDDPNIPDNDLNFGAVYELFYSLVDVAGLSRTQFNLYWSAYMAEITDKDSKMLIGKFYLNPKDIFDLDFSKYVSVDGVLFRLNKIVDYNVSNPSECTVQLIKVINTSYSFPKGSFDTGIDRFLLWNDTEPLIDYDNAEILYI